MELSLPGKRGGVWPNKQYPFLILGHPFVQTLTRGGRRPVCDFNPPRKQGRSFCFWRREKLVGLEVVKYTRPIYRRCFPPAVQISYADLNSWQELVLYILAFVIPAQNAFGDELLNSCSSL